MSIVIMKSKDNKKYEIVMPYDKESASKLLCCKVSRVDNTTGEQIITYEKPIKSA